MPPLRLICWQPVHTHTHISSTCFISLSFYSRKLEVWCFFHSVTAAVQLRIELFTLSLSFVGRVLPVITISLQMVGSLCQPFINYLLIIIVIIISLNDSNSIGQFGLMLMTGHLKHLNSDIRKRVGTEVMRTKYSRDHDVYANLTHVLSHWRFLCSHK